VPRGKFDSTNQNHYPDLGTVTRHQYGISALVFQTSFRGETSGGVAKCRLFSQAKIKCTLKTNTINNNIIITEIPWQ